MRQMQDSGVEWIGITPSDWQIMRMKNCILRHDAGAWGDEKQGNDRDIICMRVADFDYQRLKFTDSVDFTIRNYAKEQIDKLILRNGDILIEKSGGGDKTPVGRAVIYDRETPALFANFLERIQTNKNMDSKFLLYILSAFYSNGYIKNYVKQTTGIQNLDIQAMISSVFVAVPKIHLQQHISNFLDTKCAKIDVLISKQQEAIEKLKAYKLSVIAEAVTKGLNPEAPMRDSGIKWLGCIPQHWEFRRTKSMAKIVDCKNRTPENKPEGEFTVVRTTCIKDGKFSYEGSFQTDEENYTIWTERGAPKSGDVFFTREAPMGEACMVPDVDNLCMGQRVMYFRPFDDVDGRFILYSIYGPLVREYIESKSKGSTVGHLKLGQVADLPMLYCPYEEQQQICNYLDRECEKIEALIQKKQTVIERLTEYKKSLIYEVVTGKREV